MTELYKLFDKNSGQLLGLFRLDTEIKDESFQYKETHNTQAELTIRLEFTPYDDLDTRTYHSYFLASYIHKPFVDIGPRASISSHNPFNIGGIELNPQTIRGHRIGGMILYKIVQWLQQYPLDTQVNPIDFVPSGHAKTVQRFYENAGVPVNGDPFTIADLKLNLSWQQNIQQVDSMKLKEEIIQLKQFLAGAAEQVGILKVQLRELCNIQYTLNPWIALMSCTITPNMLPTDHSSAVDITDLPNTDQGLISHYVSLSYQAEQFKTQIARQLTVFDEFNHYKKPQHRWRNLGFALMGCIRAYQTVWIMLLIILVLLILLK